MIGISSEPPLVTFAILAYNQEGFIRAAVQAAFAQTYSPLEIILSDDSSSDGTADILQQMADDYDGPHLVRINRNRSNLGIFHHVLAIGKMARGKLVVVAAGDDISKPERCEVLQRRWASTGAAALCSDHDIMDESGHVVRCNGGFPQTASFRRYLPGGGDPDLRLLQGSTAAYAREVLDLDLVGAPKAFAEDNIFNFLLALRGEPIEHVRESLVLYRVHGAAVHNRPHGTMAWADREQHTLLSAQRNLLKMEVFRMMIERESAALGRAENRRFLHDEARLRSIAAWPQLAFPNRVREIMRFAASGDARAVGWMLLRLFGSVELYQPGKLIHTMLHRLRKSKGP